MTTPDPHSMRLKAHLKTLAQEQHLPPQLVLQNFMIERFLERLAHSPYRSHVIIKGGFLIASMVGIASRTTMDLDATLKRLPATPETLQEMISTILSTPVEDGVSFESRTLSPIREHDDYPGFRVALIAHLGHLAVPLKVDLTVGDKITPRAITYRYKLLMEDRTLSLLAYNLSTLLAEKLETIISRGDQNTRPRDFYDITLLAPLPNLNPPQLAQALLATAQKRGSLNLLPQANQILETIRNSPTMRQRWENYQRTASYAQHLSFVDACSAIHRLMESILPHLSP